MSKEGSKFGRRSNWFKIKFLLEERQRKSIERSPQSTFDPSDELDTTTNVPSIFEKFVESQMQQQLSTSPTSFNGNDLPSYANVPQHISPPPSTAFPSATIQYLFHSPFLYSTIEKLTAFYLNHHILKQQSLQHQQHQQHQLAQSPPQQFNNFDAHSYSSNLNTDYSVEMSDKQDNPIDLSVKPKFPIDFTISGLMKVRSS